MVLIVVAIFHCCWSCRDSRASFGRSLLFSFHHFPWTSYNKVHLHGDFKPQLKYSRYELDMKVPTFYAFMPEGADSAEGLEPASYSEEYTVQADS